MEIKRILSQAIESKLYKGKAIILLGARQVGKSTLLNHIVENIDERVLTLNCDEPENNTLLSNPSAQQLSLLIGNYKVISIDEAQRVENIGLTLKRIIDNYPNVQLLVTGSSSFQIRDIVNEPLTGRKYEYDLYPISTKEIYDTWGLPHVMQLTGSRLIYGSYPEIITHPQEAKELLISLTDSYLYKDILTLDSLRRPLLLNKILIALALQLGSEVSYNELAKTVGTDSKTVEKYIDLLEKCFVIFKLNAFSRNLRNELKKSKKIYFYDNGVRNAIIQNFAPAELRNDMGALWENFFISERMKFNAYRGHKANMYFWRTTSQQEIDYIEESDGKFALFEMKWYPSKAKTKFPETFLKTYPIVKQTVITPENYIENLI